MTSFSEAVTKRDPATGVVDPRSGELVDLTNAPHPELVDVFLELDKREKAFKAWRTAVEDELVRRHGDKRAAEVVGDHEVDVDRGYSRVWDPEELEGVLGYLSDHDFINVVSLGEILKTETKVDGRKAAQLLNRVDGDALVELRRCFTWEQRGRAKVKVTPVATLEP